MNAKPNLQNSIPRSVLTTKVGVCKCIYIKALQPPPIYTRITIPIQFLLIARNSHLKKKKILGQLILIRQIGRCFSKLLLLLLLYYLGNTLSMGWVYYVLFLYSFVVLCYRSTASRNYLNSI